MTWEVEYFKEAEKDLVKFDHSQKLHILKAIEKVSQNPLPDYEGGYGKPLGNHNTARLAGYFIRSNCLNWVCGLYMALSVRMRK